jgi:hypothetical protein
MLMLRKVVKRARSGGRVLHRGAALCFPSVIVEVLICSKYMYGVLIMVRL